MHNAPVEFEEVSYKLYPPLINSANANWSTTIQVFQLERKFQNCSQIYNLDN